MAELVKWLTRRIVAPVCMGSIPIFRPIWKYKRNLKKVPFYVIMYVARKLAYNKKGNIQFFRVECLPKYLARHLIYTD